MDNKKILKILVVGCGVISRHWFEYTISRSDLKIIGIVDINRAAAEEKATRYQLDCEIFTDIDTALEKTKPDIVYDLSFVTTHKEITLKSFEAGCNVFSEKPMTIDRESAHLLLKTAKSKGLKYFIMQNRRYQKPMQALKELIASKRLGEIWTVCADIFVPADLKSIRNTLKNPMLQDNAIHTFDGVRFITGAEPVSVYCYSYNPKESKYKGNAAGVCVFKMSDGSVFVYNCVMGVEGCNTSWESSWRIIGSEGSVVWDGTNAPYAEVLIKRDHDITDYDKFTPTTKWDGKEQHFGCLEEMVEAFLAGKNSQTDGTDNYRSISMVFASLESAKSGNMVRVMDNGFRI